MPVHIVHEGRGVYSATLDNQSKRNALNMDMFDTLSNALETLPSSGNARALIVKGAPGFFCSGRDLSEIESQKVGIQELLAPIVRLANAFRACSIPTLAFIQGKAVGLGVSLTCWSDIAIASTDATFSLPEARAGITPTLAAISVINIIGYRHSLEMCLTGQAVDAETAARIGLIHYVSDPEAVHTRLDKVITAILKGGPEALRRTKMLHQEAQTLDFDRAIDLATQVASESLSSSEALEGIRAFKEKRLPQWAETFE